MTASKRFGELPERATETHLLCLVASARTCVVNNIGRMDYPRYRAAGRNRLAPAN